MSEQQKDGYKKLYDAQVKEHEVTHKRLRTVEKENANLRGIIGSKEDEYQNAIRLMHRISDHILKDFPKDERDE